MCTHMASKNISITEEAYGLLLENKKENESFSKEIIRNFSKKKVDLMQFYGAGKEDRELWDEVEKNILERRKRNKVLRKEKMKRLWGDEI